MSDVHGALRVVIDHVTRTAAQQSAEALHTHEVAVRLAARYAGVTTAYRAGHLFEVMHAHSFNHHALTTGSALRAAVTEWMPGGSQTAAADLLVLDGAEVAAQVQAKLYESAVATVYAVGHEHYAGMGRLVASDRVGDVGSLLDERLAMNPHSPLLARYRDAAAHLGDRVEVGGVRSRAVSLEQARRAADDPAGWAARQVAASAARQAGSAAVTSAALAAVVEAGRAMATARGDDRGVVQALRASGGTIAAAGARAGSSAALGEGVRLAAMAGLLPRALALGTLPVTMGASVVEVAGHGAALAGGQITVTGLVSASAATIGRSGVVWAFTVAGQTAVPVPVVGGLAGALAGQAVAQALERAVELALVATRGPHAPEEHMVTGLSDVVADVPDEPVTHEAGLGRDDVPSPTGAAAHAQCSDEPRSDSLSTDVPSTDDLDELLPDDLDLARLLLDDAFTLVLDPNRR